MITHRRFGQESPHLHQTCILGYSWLVLKMGVIDVDIEGHLTQNCARMTDLGQPRGVTCPKVGLVQFDEGLPRSFENGLKCQSINQCWCLIVKTLSASLTHRGWDKMAAFFADDTFKRIFLNENIRISIKISLKFVPKGLINNIPALVLSFW